MCKDLKQVYPRLVYLSAAMNVDAENFEWFKTKDNDIFGIPKVDLTQKEKLLLESFTEPYRFHQPLFTKQEQLWFDWLFHGTNPLLKKEFHIPKRYRYVFFSFSNTDVDTTTFHEAIQGLFPQNMPILWEDAQHGVIIEELFDPLQELASYEQIIDILMSDFYVKFHVYVSEVYAQIDKAPEAFRWGKNCSQTIQRYSQNPVTTYIDVIPYIFMDAIDQNTYDKITAMVLGDVAEDEELLKTIQIYLESNSNTTLAAKRLYMHRNSLQYRVDKFIEKTGVDVKQFHGALTTYLALLLITNKSSL